MKPRFVFSKLKLVLSYREDKGYLWNHVLSKLKIGFIEDTGISMVKDIFMKPRWSIVRVPIYTYINI